MIAHILWAYFGVGLAYSLYLYFSLEFNKVKIQKIDPNYLAEREKEFTPRAKVASIADAYTRTFLFGPIELALTVLWWITGLLHSTVEWAKYGIVEWRLPLLHKWAKERSEYYHKKYVRSPNTPVEP